MPTKYTLNEEQKERKALTDKILYAKKKKAKKLAKINLEKPKIKSDILLNDIINSDSDAEIDPIPYEQPSRLKYTFV
jgi:hypothetical protein